jgi:hypothetical protein
MLSVIYLNQLANKYEITVPRMEYTLVTLVKILNKREWVARSRCYVGIRGFKKTRPRVEQLFVDLTENGYIIMRSDGKGRTYLKATDAYKLWAASLSSLVTKKRTVHNSYIPGNT